MHQKRRVVAFAVPGVLAAGLLASDVSVLASMPTAAVAVPRVGPVAGPVPAHKAAPAKAAAKRSAKPGRVTASRRTQTRLVDPPTVALMPAEKGYRLVGAKGVVYAFAASPAASLHGHRLAAPIVSAVSTPKSAGYRLVGSDGGVYALSGARYYGSLANTHLHSRIAAAAGDPATGGYWLAGADGGVFAFHAAYHGSAVGMHLRSPIVGMAATPTGRGYWLVSRDGGVFAFGDARFHGAAAGRVRSAVVGMAANSTGKGYWLLTANGAVMSYGTARNFGGANHTKVSSPVTSMAVTPGDTGYWLASADGGIFTFGSAPYHGSAWVPPRPKPHHAAVKHAAPASKLLVAATHRGSAPATGGEVEMASFGFPGVYAPGTTGLDVSQYQCGNIPSKHTPIAIVQVSGGQLNSSPNPCYAEQARWAGHQLSTYIYLDGLPNPAPAESMSGRAGNCTANEGGCQAYNFGWNWSRHWVEYSRSLGIDPKLWWLDVEAGSGWGDTVINDLVIRGAYDGLHSESVNIGIYSTAYQWSAIAGSLTFPGVPVWVPGAGNLRGGEGTAEHFCRSGAQNFAGGRLALVQWGYTGDFPGAYSGPSVAYDQDYACPR